MRKIASIVLALFAFNILFFPLQKNFFGNLIFPSGATLGFVGFIVSFLAFQYLAFFDSTDHMKNKVIHRLSAAALLLAAVSVFRTSDIDTLVFNVLSFVIATLCLYVFSLPRGQTLDSLFEIFIAPIALFFESFSGFVRGLKFIQTPKINLSKYLNSGVLYVLAGIVVGLPVVAVIVALLSSADPVFSKFVENLIKIKDFPWWFVSGSISRAFFSFFILLVAIGAAFLSITKKGADVFEKTEPFRNSNLALLATSVVVMVAGVLLTYIVVEYPYLFANVAESELKQFGINTLSEYVTKGFSELMVVSVLVYLTAVISMVIYKLDGKGSTVLRWLNIILLSEVIVFISSIFRRVFIYQQEHGLTRIRIYGSVFLVGLIIWTLILMLRHSKKNLKWFWYELSVFVLLAATIFIVRPDYIIATKFKPTVNKEIDYIHISRLSAEAVDGWIEGYEDAVGKVEALESKDRSSWSDEDERQAYYAYLTLNILRKNSRTLVLKHGSAEDLWDAKATRRWPGITPDLKSLNFTEKAALEKIKKEIGLKTLIENEEKAWKLLSNGGWVNIDTSGGYFRQGTNGASIHKKFDRSFESPLLEDITIDDARY